MMGEHWDWEGSMELSSHPLAIFFSHWKLAEDALPTKVSQKLFASLSPITPWERAKNNRLKAQGPARSWDQSLGLSLPF